MVDMSAYPENYPAHDADGVILDGEELSDPSAPVVKRGRIRTSMDAYLTKLLNKLQRPNGSEMPDPVPMAPPIGWVKQPSMVEHMRALIRSESLRMAAEASGAETFEEADDFDVPEDFEPVSAYEFEEIFEPIRSAEPAAPLAPDPVPPADGPKPRPDSAPAPIAPSSDAT